MLATAKKAGDGASIFVRVCGGSVLKSGSCLQFLSLGVLCVTWPGPPSDLARAEALLEEV